MKAANLNPLDRSPANIVFFPLHAGSSRRITLVSPPGKRRVTSASTVAANVRSRRIMEDPIAQGRIAALFALKREEKAPENFIRDALEVLHRRNAIYGTALVR